MQAVCRWDGGASTAGDSAGRAQAALQRVGDRFLSMRRHLGASQQGIIDFACTKVPTQP